MPPTDNSNLRRVSNGILFEWNGWPSVSLQIITDGQNLFRWKKFVYRDYSWNDYFSGYSFIRIYICHFYKSHNPIASNGIIKHLTTLEPKRELKKSLEKPKLLGSCFAQLHMFSLRKEASARLLDHFFQTYPSYI